MSTYNTRGWPRSSHRPRSGTRLKTVFKRNPESHQHPFQDEQVFGIRKDDVCKSGGGENISIIPVGFFCPKMDTSAWHVGIMFFVFVLLCLCVIFFWSGSGWHVHVGPLATYAPQLIWRILWVKAGKGKDKNSPWSHLGRWGSCCQLRSTILGNITDIYWHEGNNLSQYHSPLFTQKLCRSFFAWEIM